MATLTGPDTDSAGSTHVGRPRLPRIFWVAVILVGLLVALWLISVLALPGLRQAAISGNEASAVGYVRAVAMAQAVAASFNKGFHLPLACLSDPAQCPPAVSPQPLLASTLTDSYATFFTVVSSPTAEEIAAAGAAARSIKDWVLVVLPRQPGVTGQRVFCTDASGQVFFTPDANTLPETSRGRCGGADLLK